MVRIYDRNKKEYYCEIQYGERALKFLYNNPFGRLLLKIAVSKSFSRLEQRRKDSPESVSEIPTFIRKYGINTEDFVQKEYSSFNDFFTRRLKKGARPVCTDKHRIIAPADAKLLVYDISDNLRLQIKNSVYDVASLLRNSEAAKRFAGGKCFVYRLTVDDYHRYCFCESGKITARKRIDGILHTVSSISEKYRVFTENCREYCIIKNETLGDIVQLEVGAMLVGKIVNYKTSEAERGREKGFFSYGGSTVAILYGKGRVMPDDDIRKNSAIGIETKVKYGESVGEIIC